MSARTKGVKAEGKLVTRGQLARVVQALAAELVQRPTREEVAAMLLQVATVEAGNPEYGHMPLGGLTEKLPETVPTDSEGAE